MRQGFGEIGVYRVIDPDDAGPALNDRVKRWRGSLVNAPWVDQRMKKLTTSPAIGPSWSLRVPVTMNTVLAVTENKLVFRLVMRDADHVFAS